ncbi:SRPBCC family protein [uncultured Winogradskyella sp.]|uniref:SRPBCC family protein n=1 Tax=uncultured Winogradskyella sp. TaxID=395353 RepID=UPI0030DD13EE
MKYTTEILIQKPIEYVIRKMDSSENMKHWQEGLVSTEHISGTPGMFGAKMKLNYGFGKRKMELVETITKQNFPEEIHATYSTKGIRNIQQNYFKSTGDSCTKWIATNEFQPTNFKMNAMLFLMPKAFKKQTKTYMANFKNFVEQGISITNAKTKVNLGF